MAIEIERKFLVTSDNYRLGSAHKISQGYICSENDRVVRVRAIDNKGFVTIKNATIGFARNEYEYEIPYNDAIEMLKNTCQHPIIEKTRYKIEFGDFVWEVDEFHGDNQGLVVAEIELPRKDSEFPLPDFVGEEVTGEAKYYNASLFKFPYKEW